MVSSEFEDVLKNETAILKSSSTVHLVVAGTCLLFGLAMTGVVVPSPYHNSAERTGLVRSFSSGLPQWCYPQYCRSILPASNRPDTHRRQPS